MEKLERGDINLEPIYTFFKEDISPKDFAKLLDEFLYNYVILFIQSQSDACALHEQSAPAASNRKISKLQIILVKLCLKQVYFSRGCKSLMHGVVPEALASRKLVVGDDSSEGSETAKSGTDEQKRYMRHNCLG